MTDTAPTPETTADDLLEDLAPARWFAVRGDGAQISLDTARVHSIGLAQTVDDLIDHVRELANDPDFERITILATGPNDLATLAFTGAATPMPTIAVESTPGVAPDGVTPDGVTPDGVALDGVSEAEVDEWCRRPVVDWKRMLDGAMITEAEASGVVRQVTGQRTAGLADISDRRDVIRALLELARAPRKAAAR